MASDAELIQTARAITRQMDQIETYRLVSATFAVTSVERGVIEIEIGRIQRDVDELCETLRLQCREAERTA